MSTSNHGCLSIRSVSDKSLSSIPSGHSRPQLYQLRSLFGGHLERQSVSSFSSWRSTAIDTPRWRIQQTAALYSKNRHFLPDQISYFLCYSTLGDVFLKRSLWPWKSLEKADTVRLSNKVTWRPEVERALSEQCAHSGKLRGRMSFM